MIKRTVFGLGLCLFLGTIATTAAAEPLVPFTPIEKPVLKMCPDVQVSVGKYSSLVGPQQKRTKVEAFYRNVGNAVFSTQEKRAYVRLYETMPGQAPVLVAEKEVTYLPSPDGAPRKLVAYSPIWPASGPEPTYRFVFVKKEGLVIECNNANNEAVN